MVVQGKANTLSVTMDDMLYHTKLVAGAAQRALVIGDMPFMSYQASSEDALRNAGRFLQAGAQAIKLEGGAVVVDRVAAMTSIGIPVMGHLGMTPQSVHRYGGYKVQGKESDHALVLLNDAKALEAAGAFAIVLEAIPAELAKTITEQLTIPTIGIGAGPHCDGQILVLYDLSDCSTISCRSLSSPMPISRPMRCKPLAAIRKKSSRASFRATPSPTTSRLKVCKIAVCIRS